MGLTKFVVFVGATVGLAYLSRKSMGKLRSHGFYRFFAWEAILVLILLNIEYWFHAPFSAHQIVSWLLLISSGFLVIDGVRLLLIIGKPDKRREDPSLVGIEKTTALVTAGSYRYIRHPLYGSLLSLAWGVFFKEPSWIGLVPAVLATVFLAITAKIEEAENMQYFGNPYREYMKQTKMFVPFLY